MKLFLVVIVSALASAAALTPITNANIKNAASEWVSNPSDATVKYGNITDWKTGDVTDMDALFMNAASFDEDLSKWDMSNVTTVKYVSTRARISSAHRST